MKNESLNDSNTNLREKLKKEAEEYNELSKSYKRQSFMNSDNEAYLLSQKWLKKWKSYVNYEYIKQNSRYSFYSRQQGPFEINEEDFPGPINNEDLIYPTDSYLHAKDEDLQVIRHDLDQKEDIKLVSKRIWDFFHSRYGGGPVIVKHSIVEKSKYTSYKTSIIEIYLRKMKFLQLPPRKALTADYIGNLTESIIFISRVKELIHLKEKFLRLVRGSPLYDERLSVSDIRFWKIPGHLNLEEIRKTLRDNMTRYNDSNELLEFEHMTFLEYNIESSLDDTDIADSDFILVEQRSLNGNLPAQTPTPNQENGWIFKVKKIETKNGKCEWCNTYKLLKTSCVCKEVWYCCDQCKLRDHNYHADRCKRRFEVEEETITQTTRSKNGLVGLQNIGNTCFMSSSLQCLSNCFYLTQYFIYNHYKKDINVDNPIGSQGNLAKSYANLMKNIWFGESSAISPWGFKRAIATFQSMFTGYQQHDTQEFLNYLLDGLHEDLNRVKKKPLIEKDESKKDLEIKAQESWVNFLRRNQSFLVDLLYGQFKSTLYCPCENNSTCFDPFLSISLPLASRQDTLEVLGFFLFFDISITPIQLNLQFPANTSVMALRNKVGKILNIHPYSFFIIKMDRDGLFDHIVHSQSILKSPHSYFSNNQKPYFMFQIDPNLFYSNFNSYFNNLNSSVYNQARLDQKRDFSRIFKELEQRRHENEKLFSDSYDEEEDGDTAETENYYSTIRSSYNNVLNFKYNVDNNHGFDSRFLKVVMYLKSSDRNTSRIIFPRIIYVDLHWTTRQLHLYIFQYFRNVLEINKRQEFDKSHRQEFFQPKRIEFDFSEKLKDFPLDYDKLLDEFNSYFQNLDCSNENDNIGFQAQNNYPYRVRIKNIYSHAYEKCPHCLKSRCDDCLLPFDDTRIVDLISKFPKSEENRHIDNTFLYLSERQKALHKDISKDFELSLTWLTEYTRAVKTLNDKTDLDFKITRHSKQNEIDIGECFKNFFKLEKLQEGNEWYCPECKTHQKATKKMEIYKVPPILIIHLKRFNNSRKINTLVNFPIEGLDMKPYVKTHQGRNLKYDLFGISNHYGNLGFGHYIAYAKNPFNQKWYEYDDTQVSEMNESNLITSGAYVLFYKSQDIEKEIDVGALNNRQFIDYENKMEIDK